MEFNTNSKFGNKNETRKHQQQSGQLISTMMKTVRKK